MRVYHYVTTIRIEANDEDEAHEKLCALLEDDTSTENPDVWALDTSFIEEIEEK